MEGDSVAGLHRDVVSSSRPKGMRPREGVVADKKLRQRGLDLSLDLLIGEARKYSRESVESPQSIIGSQDPRFRSREPIEGGAA
jgi:hypothetical protein